MPEKKAEKKIKKFSKPEIIAGLQGKSSDKNAVETHILNLVAQKKKAKDYLMEAFFQETLFMERKYDALEEDEIFDAYYEAIDDLIKSLVEEKYRGETTLRNFFQVIYNRRCYDQYRKKKNKVDPVDFSETNQTSATFLPLRSTDRNQEEQLLFLEGATDQATKQAICRQKLIVGMKSLKTEHRELLYLRKYLKFNYEDIAQITKYNKNVAKTMVERQHKKLLTIIRGNCEVVDCCPIYAAAG